jgi:hypothetical protein
MEEQLVEKDGKKNTYKRGMEEAPENQGIVAFCTCQWNE